MFANRAAGISGGTGIIRESFLGGSPAAVNFRKGITYLGRFAAVFATRAAAVHEHGCLVQLLGECFTSKIGDAWHTWDEDPWMRD
jgi:hypothetical protein